jgi:hypothetical protein
MDPPEIDSAPDPDDSSELRLDNVPPTDVRRERIAAAPDRVWTAMRRAADAWGAEWEPGAPGGVGAGRLRLPVTAGIRYGVIDAEVSVEPVVANRAGGFGKNGEKNGEEITEVAFRPSSSLYFLNTTVLAILVFSALGGLLLVLWPFFPEAGLEQVAPLGVVVALVGWFLVVSRMENRGPDEFFELLEREAQRRTGNGSSSAAAADVEEEPESEE